jgi:hypothetical protein
MSKKKTTEQFVLEARQVHGNKYQYNHEYINTISHMIITCNKHGDFKQQPAGYNLVSIWESDFKENYNA